MAGVILDDVLLSEFERSLKNIESFLKSCDIQPRSYSLRTMVNQLDEIVAVRKGKKYYGVALTPDGVIKDFVEIQGIIDYQELPKDLLRGYYTYQKGKIVLDEKLRAKMWG